MAHVSAHSTLFIVWNEGLIHRCKPARQEPFHYPLHERIAPRGDIARAVGDETRSNIAADKAIAVIGDNEIEPFPPQ